MSENKKDAGLAIASMVLGIISFVFFGGILTAIPAIICGHIAIGKVKRGEAKGYGMAIAGLCLGYLSAVI